MDIRDYINKAIQENKEITIKYQKYDGTVSTRRISNIELSDEFGDGYIRAYCHLRNEERTFKISRIIEADGIKRYPSSIPYSSRSHTSRSYSSSNYSSSSSGYHYSQPTRNNEGCYIATMAYGDYDHPQVLTLRKYRDEILAASFLGRKFILIYYMISPKLVVLFKNHKNVNRFIRKILDKFVLRIRRKYFEPS